MASATITTQLMTRPGSLPLIDLARGVERGVQAHEVAWLLRDGEVTLGDLDGIVAARRTLERRLAAKTALTIDESDRYLRFVAVLGLAVSVFESTATAMAWLRSPKRRFAGDTPLAMLRSDAGARLVEEVLDQSLHGYVA